MLLSLELSFVIRCANWVDSAGRKTWQRTDEWTENGGTATSSRADWGNKGTETTHGHPILHFRRWTSIWVGYKHLMLSSSIHTHTFLIFWKSFHCASYLLWIFNISKRRLWRGFYNCKHSMSLKSSLDFHSYSKTREFKVDLASKRLALN